METAVPYAVDEQLRVEALRAAVSLVAADPYGDAERRTRDMAERFEAWLTR